MQMHLVVTLDDFKGAGKAEDAEGQSFPSYALLFFPFSIRSCRHLSCRMDLRHELREVCRAESEARVARHGNLPEKVDGKVHGPGHHGLPRIPGKCAKFRFHHGKDRHLTGALGVCYESIWEVSLETRERKVY